MGCFLRGFGVSLSAWFLAPAVGLSVAPVTSHGDGITKDGRRATAATHAKLWSAPMVAGMPGRPADLPHGPLDGTAADAVHELRKLFDPLRKAFDPLRKLGRWRKPTTHLGTRDFLESGLIHDWLLLAACFVLFTVMFMIIRCGNDNGKITNNIFMVVFWNCVAFWFDRHVSYYRAPTMDWYNGYLLELVFSLENVFIFSSVLGMFQVPGEVVPWILYVVVCWQNICGMLLYIGLAEWLQAILVLPYILGIWLIFVGVQMLRHDDHQPHDDPEGSRIVGFFERCLGDRVTRDYSAGFCLCAIDGGRCRMRMCAPALGAVLLVDLLMELDVTLTKIEEIENHYIAFASSAIASFAMPALYTLFTECFHQFHLLKYGIAAVMLLYGGELLLHQIVEVPEAVNLIGMFAAIALSMALSCCFPNGHEDKEAGEVQGSVFGEQPRES